MDAKISTDNLPHKQANSLLIEKNDPNSMHIVCSQVISKNQRIDIEYEDEEPPSNNQKIDHIFLKFEELGIPYEHINGASIIVNQPFDDTSILEKNIDTPQFNQFVKFRRESFGLSSVFDHEYVSPILEKIELKITHIQASQLQKKFQKLNLQNIQLKAEIKSFFSAFQSQIIALSSAVNDLFFKNQFERIESEKQNVLKKSTVSIFLPNSNIFDENQALREKNTILEQQIKNLKEQHQRQIELIKDEMKIELKIKSQAEQSIEAIELENSDLKYELARSEHELRKIEDYEREIKELNATLLQNSQYIFDLEQAVSSKEFQFQQQRHKLKTQFILQLQRQKQTFRSSYQVEFQIIKGALEEEIARQVENKHHDQIERINYKYLSEIASKKKENQALLKINEQMNEEAKLINGALEEQGKLVDSYKNAIVKELVKKETLQQQYNTLKQQLKVYNLYQNERNQTINPQVENKYQISKENHSLNRISSQFRKINPQIIANSPQFHREHPKYNYQQWLNKGHPNRENQNNRSSTKTYEQLQNLMTESFERYCQHRNPNNQTINIILKRIKSKKSHHPSNNFDQILKDSDDDHSHTYQKILKSGRKPSKRKQHYRRFNHLHEQSISPSSAFLLEKEKEAKINAISQKLEQLRSEIKRQIDQNNY